MDEDIDIGPDETAVAVPAGRTDPNQLYCLCRQPDDPDNPRDYIACDSCEEWFHPECVDLTLEVRSLSEGPYSLLSALRTSKSILAPSALRTNSLHCTALHCLPPESDLPYKGQVDLTQGTKCCLLPLQVHKIYKCSIQTLDLGNLARSRQGACTPRGADH